MNYGALRSELSTKHYNALTTKETKDKWKSTYGDERGWVSKCFADYDSASTLKGKLISLKVENPQSDDDFVKKYACDLNWAKDQEYCKVAPKQDQWLDLEEENKTKFIEEFPCIASIISGNGRQKMYPEGMVFLLPVNFEGRKCNVYMLNSGDETKSKWDGLIIDRSTKERGQFKCEGDEGNSSSDLDIE
jgi:hypothetical protein